MTTVSFSEEYVFRSVFSLARMAPHSEFVGSVRDTLRNLLAVLAVWRSAANSSYLIKRRCFAWGVYVTFRQPVCHEAVEGRRGKRLNFFFFPLDWFLPGSCAIEEATLGSSNFAPVLRHPEWRDQCMLKQISKESHRRRKSKLCKTSFSTGKSLLSSMKPSLFHREGTSPDGRVEHIDFTEQTINLMLTLPVRLLSPCAPFSSFSFRVNQFCSNTTLSKPPSRCLNSLDLSCPLCRLWCSCISMATVSLKLSMWVH